MPSTETHTPLTMPVSTAASIQRPAEGGRLETRSVSSLMALAPASASSTTAMGMS